VLAKDGFDVARQIADWLYGQDREAALKHIDSAERILKGKGVDDDDVTRGSETHSQKSPRADAQTVGNKAGDVGPLS